MPDQSVDGRGWSITCHAVGDDMRASIGGDTIWIAARHRRDPSMWVIRNTLAQTPLLTALVSDSDIGPWLHHLMSHELLARKVLAAQPDSSVQ